MVDAQAKKAGGIVLLVREQTWEVSVRVCTGIGGIKVRYYNQPAICERAIDIGNREAQKVALNPMEHRGNDHDIVPSAIRDGMSLRNAGLLKTNPRKGFLACMDRIGRWLNDMRFPGRMVAQESRSYPT
ncbi:unnamed protein product, partial [marine sediment metagenome]